MYQKVRTSSVLVLTLLLCSAWVTILNIGIVKAESNSLIPVRHSSIQEVLEGTRRNSFVGSFNASKGYFVKLNLSSYSTNNGPFSTYVRICSDNHGVIFGAGGPNFSQKVILDFEDTYNITIYKSPTFSSVQFVGAIDVFHEKSVGQSSENWVAVTRFNQNSKFLQRDFTFTIEHVDWRIRWEYEPDSKVSEDQPALYVYVWDQEIPDKYFESILKKGTNETSGMLYIYNRTGAFFLGVTRTVPRFTLVIEQNVDSIPEFPQWTILPLILTFNLFSIIVKRKLFSHKSKVERS